MLITLTPPNLADNCIEEKIICIRAHRERIFRVEVTRQQEKLICHNYGQGGAGWTFLFGCVQKLIRDFEEHLTHNAQFKNKPIAVIGAGCYGLLTAIILARAGYSVRILAKDQIQISSRKSAGFFFPRHRKCSTDQEIALFQYYGFESYKTYLDIITGVHDFIKTGPKLLPAYFGLDIDPGFAPYIATQLIASAEQVTINFGHIHNYLMQKYTVVFINPEILMHELYRNIQELNIPIIQAEIEQFEQVSESIIFNCAGLGVRELTQDPAMVPVQGHLIALKHQPPLEQLQYMLNVKVVMTDKSGKSRDELIYYAPKQSGILGVTFIRGQDSLTANQHEFDRILERSRTFFGI
jgi:D-amino-acid oxidase